MQVIPRFSPVEPLFDDEAPLEEFPPEHYDRIHVGAQLSIHDELAIVCELRRGRPFSVVVSS